MILYTLHSLARNCATPQDLNAIRQSTVQEELSFTCEAPVAGPNGRIVVILPLRRHRSVIVHLHGLAVSLVAKRLLDSTFRVPEPCY